MTKITKSQFGTTASGCTVDSYTLTNAVGSSVSIITYGASVTSIMVRDKDGVLRQVAMGYDELGSYEKQDKLFGAIVGRHANRLGGAVIRLSDGEHALTRNEGENHIHGGVCGFNRKVWSAVADGEKLVLSLTSPDGEEGFPGNLSLSVTYSLDDDNTLTIDYDGVSDKETVVNLTNHLYFNLSGDISREVSDQLLRVDADSFTVNDAHALPTGEIRAVTGTPFDFREPRAIGEGIAAQCEQIQNAHGYDQNFVLNGNGFRPVAELFCPESGIVMDTFTDMPGMQLYTANFLEGAPALRGNVECRNHTAVCLETQFFPNAFRCDGFIKPVLAAGERYCHKTSYRFGVRNDK